MRRPATRSLHVLLSVPVVTAAVIAASPTAHAQPAPPQPLVIVIDPGHGGAIDPSQPDMPFDPGAIAPSNGLMEKDATLAVSLRLRTLLEQDAVDVVLTRSTDEALTVQQRSDTANNNNAALYVSVHFNSFTDSGPSGSLVLYPNDADVPFAQAMSDAMARYLGPLGVADDGIQLRDNWWIHTRMPTVTVEPAYLSNAREAALIASASFQQVLATSLRAGIESYMPAVLQRKAEILAWNTAHPEHRVRPLRPASAHTTATAATTSGSAAPLVRNVLLLALLGAVLRWPRPAWRLLLAVAVLLHRGVDRVLIKRAARRRRRRAVELRSLAAQAQRFARPHHIYDELF